MTNFNKYVILYTEAFWCLTEHALVKGFKLKKIFNKNVFKYGLYTLLIVVAIFSGVVIGDLYVTSLPANIDLSSFSEAELREDPQVVKALYEDAISGKKTSFSAVELYQIAEYKLSNTSRYVKVMLGDVTNSVTGNQLMHSNKLVTENEMVYQKMSPSSGGPAPTIAARINYKNNNIYLNKEGTIANKDSKEEMKISFDDSKDFIMSEEDYKNNFNTSVTTALPYIISKYTCAEGTYDKDVRLGTDGKYTFNIKITGQYLSLAAYYYAYEIRYFSGFNVLPSWKELNMIVTVDEDFNFVSIEYDETYSMLIFINAGVEDKFVDYFYYDETTINEYVQNIGTI